MLNIESAEKRVFAEFFKTHNENMQNLHPGSYPEENPIATLILVELHYDNSDMWPETKENANFDVLKTWFDFFQLLEDQGYVIYHKEINLYIGQAAEYAFVHLDTMERLEKEFYEKSTNFNN